MKLEMGKATISEFEFLTRFDNESKAVQYFERLRWKGGVKCPYCDSENVYTLPSRQFYRRCRDCNKQFSCKTGTVMQSSPLPIRTWLHTMYKVSVARRGISSLQLAKEVGITQKSAWFMLQRIKEAYSKNRRFNLQGIVEEDETYIDDKKTNKHSNKRKQASRGTIGKQFVLGMKERGGKVKVMLVFAADKTTFHRGIRSNERAGATIFTDEYKSCIGLNYVYRHEAIHYSPGKYRRNSCYTNSIKSVWAVLKRAVYRTYHHIRGKHFEDCLDEAGFRFNEGVIDYRLIDRISVVHEKNVGIRLTQNALTG